MTATRRPARRVAYLGSVDALIVCGALSIAFALWLAPFFPEITKYDFWPAVAKLAAFMSWYGLACFAAGYWLRGRRI